MIPTLEWTQEGVRLLDQRLLPARTEYLLCRDVPEVAAGIRDMVVRGAPAIGVTAAMGVALGVKQSRAADLPAMQRELDAICSTLQATRPTAVNLAWALDRMRACFQSAGREPFDRGRIAARLEQEALAVYAEDIAINQAIGRHGAVLMPEQGRVLTHCNAGALATAGYGTALGVIRAAVAQGKKLEIFADETRPYLQGARLTVWELLQDGIPARLITDSMAGHFLHHGGIRAVVVGADRIAANGDVANKIGTYSVAVLARENQVPFYVAAPVSTLDLSLASGEQIPIEERSPEEVTHFQGAPVAPAGVPAANPAFDVTPSRYVTAIITEHGVARAPFEPALKALAGKSRSAGRAVRFRDC